VATEKLDPQAAGLEPSARRGERVECTPRHIIKNARGTASHAEQIEPTIPRRTQDRIAVSQRRARGIKVRRRQAWKIAADDDRAWSVGERAAHHARHAIAQRSVARWPYKSRLDARPLRRVRRRTTQRGCLSPGGR
jgi:hypothetical protein